MPYTRLHKVFMAHKYRSFSVHWYCMRELAVYAAEVEESTALRKQRKLLAALLLKREIFSDMIIR